MLKKIVLAGLLCGAMPSVDAVVADWQSNAARLSAAIAGMPAYFDADTIVYNSVVTRLNGLLSLFADNVADLTSVFTCLREKYSALVANYQAVLDATEVSEAEALAARLLLQGQLLALIEETNAQIATLTSERDALIIERDALDAAYTDLVGDARSLANDVVGKINALSDSYDKMVVAKDAMVVKLNEFKSDMESMFTTLNNLSTVASGEICSE